MAEKTIPISIAQGKSLLPEVLDSVGIIQDKGAFFVSSPDSVQLNFLQDGKTPAVSSLDVARHFGVRHKNVLRDIGVLVRKIPESQAGLKFEPSSYTDSTGRLLPAFLLDRNAFTLLVMGWSSKTALSWKLRYIEAFNALEQAALSRARQAALREGARIGRRLGTAGTRTVKKALRYRALGLSTREIARLLETSQRRVWHLLRDASALEEA